MLKITETTKFINLVVPTSLTVRTFSTWEPFIHVAQLSTKHASTTAKLMVVTTVRTAATLVKQISWQTNEQSGTKETRHRSS